MGRTEVRKVTATVEFAVSGPGGHTAAVQAVERRLARSTGGCPARTTDGTVIRSAVVTRVDSETA